MDVIPVIDLLRGRVVHAIKGERGKYRELHSPLCPDSRLETVVQNFQNQWGFRRFYVADLDSIQSKGNNFNEINDVASSRQVQIWLDPGIKTYQEAGSVPKVEKLVLGSESIAELEEIVKISISYPLQELMFSLDIREDTLQTPCKALAGLNLSEVVRRVQGKNVSQFIVLNLSVVGTLGGPQLMNFHDLPRAFPRSRFYYGGGIRNTGDLAHLQDLGFTGALVGSAFHLGAISREKLGRFESSF